MSRRPANFVQADLARALRAAQQAGPDWCVEVDVSVIRLMRPKTPPGVDAEPEPEQNWKL